MNQFAYEDTTKNKKKTSTIAVPFIVCNGQVDLLRSHLGNGSLVFQNGQWHFGLYCYRDGTGKLLLQILKRPISTLIVLWVSYLTCLTTMSRLSWQLEENPKISIQSTSIQSGVFCCGCWSHSHLRASPSN
jgi:hypothetical protein